jgi:hypothetical protein
MTIDPTALPRNAVVEVEGGHVWRLHELHQQRIVRVFVPVPDGVTVENAEKALAAMHPDRSIEAAIEDAVPEGEWDGRTTLANLRAAGFDVVKAVQR